MLGRMSMRWVLGMVLLAGFLPQEAHGQAQRGSAFVNLEAGGELQYYNDYSLRIADLGIGLEYLLTDWLAVGVGGRLYNSEPSVNGSVTCIANFRPGVQKLLPYVRMEVGTPAEEGTGKVWAGEAGVRYSIGESLALSSSLRYGKTFQHRSRLTEYSTFGALLRVHVRFRSGG